MRRHIVSVAFVLLGVGLLAGCGQKGPLVLPAKPAAPAPAASAPAPATSTTRPAGPATVAPVPAASSS